jgi:hypothetical protein
MGPHRVFAYEDQRISQATQRELARVPCLLFSLSRWLVVWMTFLGAIVALKEHGHLGSDMLFSRLRPAGKMLAPTEN